MNKLILVLVHILFALFSFSSLSSTPSLYTGKNIKYQSFTGKCPAKSSDFMLLMIMKEFEKNFSLKDVKQKIAVEKLDEKFFLSNYRIKYNPVKKVLNINLDCPDALAKVHIYKSNGEEHYSAILGDNSKLYEPQYEILLRSERRLRFNLPLIALTTDQLETKATTTLTELMKLIDLETRKKISEVILNKGGDLTVVFSLGGPRATSVFLGSEFWDVKITKLEKILSYVSKNKRYPTTINLVNAKKVVVKFSDSI